VLSFFLRISSSSATHCLRNGTSATNPTKERGKGAVAGKKAKFEDKIRRTKADETSFLTNFEQKQANFDPLAERIP
jgi:hypothetical protein